MKILKNLALGLLSFLLFLSLSIFGFTFMLNSTILNPDFLTSELNRLDVPSLVGEVLDEQPPEEEIPAELRATLIDTIDKVEPLVKEQIGAAIYSIYDYLLGKSQNLDLALTLRNTILSTDFIVSLLDELDISPFTTTFLSEQLTEGIPQELEYLFLYLDDAITEAKPLLEEQISVAAEPVLDYLLGRSHSLDVVISLEPVKASLKDTLREDFLESPPAELASLSRSELEHRFDEYFGQLIETVPATFELDESLFGAETPTKIAESLAEAEEALMPVRQYIGYFQLGYKVLIGLIILLIVGIILLNRRVKSATRILGIIFLAYGAIEYAGILVAKYFAKKQLTLLEVPEMPPTLQAWMPQFVDNLLVPLEILSLGLLIGGIALIIVSFVYKPRQPAP